ncbi:MAG: SDR family NAD(P)-dependent oxidoreductase [Clostridia bacterium]|nr:SDR family NAD(P)-dependent oxidoreductase [Clostridia bacterium]
MKYVVITGTARNIGLEMCREFLKRGWHVFAGRYEAQAPLLEELKAEWGEQLDIIPNDVTNPESIAEGVRIIREKTEVIDMLVHNAAAFGLRFSDPVLSEPVNFDPYVTPFDTNALGAMRMVQALLPLMQTGMKRLCFVSSEAGAVSVADRTEVSSYCMSKTALNMAVKLMFHQLQPLGYTFRLYHPGWVRSTPDGKPNPKHRGKYEPSQTARSAVPQFLENRKWEDRLVLIDVEGSAWPF